VWRGGWCWNKTFIALLSPSSQAFRLYIRLLNNLKSFEPVCVRVERKTHIPSELATPLHYVVYTKRNVSNWKLVCLKRKEVFSVCCCHNSYPEALLLTPAYSHELPQWKPAPWRPPCKYSRERFCPPQLNSLSEYMIYNIYLCFSYATAAHIWALSSSIEVC
jgi:hypothetical protein